MNRKPPARPPKTIKNPVNWASLERMLLDEIKNCHDEARANELLNWVRSTAKSEGAFLADEIITM
jgi:hypothetical protein